MNDFIYNPPKTPYLDILFEDDDLIVLNKPSGLLSVPGRLKEHYDSLLSRVKEKHPDASAVHRLDMDTSGLVVIALTKRACSAFGRMFCLKEVSKTYLAVVTGNTKPDGEINLPIRCDIEHRPLQIVDFEQGKESLTLYQKITDYTVNPDFVSTSDYSILKLTPITGRSHQLRLHLASIDHAILG
ncbi:MAG: pseudouridine synthase, partial [Succinivibrio sp.]|nr:pseudouridine synthase [Succinivibrio sp.]